MTFWFFFILHLFLANIRLLFVEDILELTTRSAEVHLHCAISFVSLASGRTFRYSSESLVHHEIVQLGPAYCERHNLVR